jgi:hypothetical protein
MAYPPKHIIEAVMVTVEPSKKIVTATVVQEDNLRLQRPQNT